jgi:hypothetical protein
LVLSRPTVISIFVNTTERWLPFSWKISTYRPVGSPGVAGFMGGGAASFGAFRIIGAGSGAGAPGSNDIAVAAWRLGIRRLVSTAMGAP